MPQGCNPYSRRRIQRFSAVLILMAAGCTRSKPDEGVPAAGNEVVTPARLDLSIEERADDVEVNLTLVNCGNEPLLIDRDLVLGVNVQVSDADGSSIALERTGEAIDDSPSKAAWSRRVVHLAPGEQVSRRFRLYEGFRVFVAAHSTSGERLEHKSQGYEATYRIPRTTPLDRISTVTVRYQTNVGIYGNAIRAYTRGSDIGTLFPGPLQAQCPIPRH